MPVANCSLEPDRHAAGHGSMGRCLGGVLVLSLALAGCGYNPALGKWNITKSEEEVEATTADELTVIRNSTGATAIEFRKDSILVTGGLKDRSESPVVYSVQPLKSGATTVQILQGKSDTNHDIDVMMISPDGNRARLESRTELVDLTRASD